LMPSKGKTGVDDDPGECDTFLHYKQPLFHRHFIIFEKKYA
jgi:hypothetical protein